MSLVLIAFGHQPLQFAAPGTIDLSVYTLPDGSLPVLCLGQDGKSGGKRHIGAGGCDACRLTASVFVISPPALVAPRAISSPRTEPVREFRVFTQAAWPPAAPPTAPPAA